MPRSLIEEKTGLKGVKLLSAIRSGTSFNLPKDQGVPAGERVKILGVPYLIAYFGYITPGKPSIEVIPVNSGIKGIIDVANQYLATTGGVPTRIDRLANLEDRFSWNPVLHHLVTASVLWLASQKNSK